mgnify:CR=1 FL=1
MLGDRYQVVYLTGCQPECRQEAKNGQWENGFYTETLQQQITHAVTEEERQRVCNALSLTNLCGRLHKATEGQNGSCYVDYPVSYGAEENHWYRAIRALPDQRLASVPIVAMTANAFDEDMHNAIQAGMNGSLAKPLDVNKLYDMMRQCLK